MIGMELMKDIDFCHAILHAKNPAHRVCISSSFMLINLGCTVEYEPTNDKNNKFTVESGSVVRVPAKTSITGHITPNPSSTTPEHLPLIISLSADPALIAEAGLVYHQRVQEAAKYSSTRLVTHLSSKDRASILLGLWPQLPAEISQHIVKQLDARGLMTFSCVSKGTNTLTYTDRSLWRALDVHRSCAKGLKLANSARRLIQRDARKKATNPNELAMTLVVTLGSHHIDAGIAGEDTPEIVIPSLVREVSSFGAPEPMYFAGHDAKLVASGTCVPVIQQKQVVNTNYLLHLIEQIYVSHPQFIFEEQLLLLSFSARNTLSNYDRFMYECLQRFNIPCIALVETETLALYTHGESDGIVVDVGYECTTIVPIVEGYAIRADMRVVPVGGRHVTLELLNRIRTEYPALNDLTEEEANDIKENYCYIKTNSPHSSLYKGERDVLIRGEYYRLGAMLHESCEVLFGSFAHGTGISDFKAQYSSSIESLEHNRPLPKVRNTVILAGGTTLLPGYLQRFRDVVHDFYAKVPSWSLRAMRERGYVGWIGGSILGSLSCHQNFWLTLEQLEQRLDRS